MNIKISKSTHSCAACGLDFQHLQELTSTVKVVEGELHRQDYCKDCWHSEQNKDVYSLWSTAYHDAKIEDAAPPEVFSPLRQLFYEPAEEESRVEMAKAFLAAGLLRRQKVFRLIKESDESDGTVRITLYADRIGNRLIEVPDPQFTYAEMDKARALLLERLQELESAGGDDPEAVPETDNPEAPPEVAPADEETVSGPAAPVAEESADDADEVSPETAGESTAGDPPVKHVESEEAVHAEA